MSTSKNKDLVALVVPIYKENPSLNEIAALNQALSVLGAYPICFVAPSKLEVRQYVDCLLKFEKFIGMEQFIRFDSHFFGSIDGYNKLLLTSKFYTAFQSYEFILIYQLDAWVFRDELKQWCEKRFDYIGAPWFGGWDQANETSPFIGVGNGGFSLRKVSSHLRVLNSFRFLESPLIFIRRFLMKPTRQTFAEMVYNLTIKNNSFHLFNTWRYNEDYFWGGYAPEKHNWFKVAGFADAVGFSWELNAELLYRMSNGRLPFGCHKWEFYCSNFWSRHIRIEHGA